MNNYAVARNSVNADIYLGQGAGKKLLNEIENAKKSVKIISPYHSINYLEKLVLLKEKGINVQLITSEDVTDYKETHKGTIKTKLVKQYKEVNEKARQKHRQISLVSKVSFILMILSVCLVIYCRLNISPDDNQVLYVPVVFLTVGIITLLWSSSITVNSYFYRELFPFKVFYSPSKLKYRHRGGFHIHAKVYIIDDAIAYLGSINLTNNGMEHSFESRIRITDPETITGLNKMFQDLFYHTDNLCLDNIAWGKQAYAETRN